MWTLGTVLLERQVRICQNTTVYMCRKKWGCFLFLKFPLWAAEPYWSPWHNRVTEGQLFLVQGETRFSGRFPACRSCIVLHPKNIPFFFPIVFVPSCQKKSAGNERAVSAQHSLYGFSLSPPVPSCPSGRAGPEDPNPVCAQLAAQIWTCSTRRGNCLLWTDKL